MQNSPVITSRRLFGSTGLEVSPLGFGAAPIGFLATEQARVDRIVDELSACGVNLIDTAAAYQGSEEALGRALDGRRDEFILISKCGQSFADLPGAEWSAEVVAATIERTLRRLRTDRLEVVLLHSCDPAVLRDGEALGALVAAREAGKIRFIGYSGDNETAAAAAAMPEIQVIETSVNLCDQMNLRRVLPATTANHCGVIAKRPLANTAWRPAETLDGMYQSYAKPYCDRFAAMDLTLAEGADWAETALRFTLFQPGVHVGIVGTTKPENIRRNAAALAKGPLPAAIDAAIREAFDRARAASGDDWPGLT